MAGGRRFGLKRKTQCGDELMNREDMSAKQKKVRLSQHGIHNPIPGCFWEGQRHIKVTLLLVHGGCTQPLMILALLGGSCLVRFAHSAKLGLEQRKTWLVNPETVFKKLVLTGTTVGSWRRLAGSDKHNLNEKPIKFAPFEFPRSTFPES